MHRPDVMTPEHPRWSEFIEDLSRALICTRTTQNARRSLEFIEGIDVEASLEALRHLHGRCDCEIVFLVAAVHSSHA